MSSKPILVLGYGPVGRAVIDRLSQRFTEVIVAQRSRPKDLPSHIAFRICDVLDSASVKSATEGMSQVVAAFGLPYSAKVWKQGWPRAMRNLVNACEASGSRLVFLDNLYMYGPQQNALREDMPLTDEPGKPAARAEATRIWMEAAAQNRLKVVALRAPDFYGPHSTLSILGDMTIGAIVAGDTAQLLNSPDIPHEFAYVPDIARAIVSLLDAPDEDFGQAWHVPSAPTKTMREVLQLAADCSGKPLKLSVMPVWLQGLVALFMPILREVRAMNFLWDRPYRVDASKFARRFWSDATPFEQGVAETVAWFELKAEKSS